MPGDIEDIIKDSKKTIEVTLPDSGETVKLAKLKYSQMKEVTRTSDNWERNDISLLASLANAGNPKSQEWLDNLSTDDVIAMSNAFAEISVGPSTGPSLEDWLREKHPKILDEFERETRRPGSNPLRGSSTREMESLSFG